MQVKWLRKQGSRRLKVFALGWAADESMLGQVEMESDCDVMCVYDYRIVERLGMEHGYAEVSLVAWSYGVWAAEQIFGGWSFVQAVAVNGTPMPVDENYGIAKRLFDLTVRGVEKTGLEKFAQRMCDGADRVVEIKRSKDECVEELKALGQQFETEYIPGIEWSRAVVGGRDLIFPPDAQKRYWSKAGVEVEYVEQMPHFPFSKLLILSRHKYMKHDKVLIEKRFGKTLHNYHSIAVVQHRIARRLAQLIPDENQQNGVEIGAGSGFLTNEIIAKFPAAKWIANDITHQSRAFLPSQVEFKCEDGELMEIPTTDIICSASTVQWFDDLPEFIARCYRALNADGVIALSTFGRENFREIGTSLSYYDIEQLADIFAQVGFQEVQLEQWTEQLEFETPLDVLRHIKATGVNAISQERWTHKKLQKFIENYPTPAVLTFHPIIIIARKR